MDPVINETQETTMSDKKTKTTKPAKTPMKKTAKAAKAPKEKKVKAPKAAKPKKVKEAKPPREPTAKFQCNGPAAWGPHFAALAGDKPVAMGIRLALEAGLKKLGKV